MSKGLPSLIQPRTFARIKAQLESWWDGAETELAEPDELLERAVRGDRARAERPPPPLDPRLAALGWLWGEGRIQPGDAADELAFLQALELRESEGLAVLGPGGIAPLAGLSEAHRGPVRAFEWRAETLEALAAAVADLERGQGLALDPFDLEAGRLAPNCATGLISFDEFTFCDNPARFATQLHKLLTPRGRALIEWSAGERGRDVAPAFASAFAEPHLRPAETVGLALAQAGFEVVAEEDVTEEHLALGRARLRAFAAGLDAPPPWLGMEALRELAWEAQSWAARRTFMLKGRISRRRLLARRRD